jgi:predicted AAA+ superfamily ATPase
MEKLLQTLDKYYFVDIGLRYFLIGDKKSDFGNILENIVYLELVRHGYNVHIGKVDTYNGKNLKSLEVDFITEGLDGT